MKAKIVKSKEELIQLGCVEFEERNEFDKFGNETLKIVGMDVDFNVLAYAVIET